MKQLSISAALLIFIYNLRCSVLVSVELVHIEYDYHSRKMLLTKDMGIVSICIFRQKSNYFAFLLKIQELLALDKTSFGTQLTQLIMYNASRVAQPTSQKTSSQRKSKTPHSVAFELGHTQLLSHVNGYMDK